MRSGIVIVVAAALTLAHAAGGRGDSIWQRARPQNGFLFEDNYGRRVGDVLTVVIRENTGIDHEEERNMEKDTKLGSFLDFSGKTSGNSSSKSATLNFNADLGSNRSIDGKAKFTSDRAFTDQMTVVVVAVQPNGNLVIDGIRRRVVSGEERTLHLTGIVRPMDIQPGNLVPSQAIGNFQIIYTGKGQESRFTNHNWFGHVMNYLWPF